MVSIGRNNTGEDQTLYRPIVPEDNLREGHKGRAVLLASESGFLFIQYQRGQKWVLI